MHKMTESWGCEWAPDGIRVNCVAPWYTRTPLAAPVFADEAKVLRMLLLYKYTSQYAFVSTPLSILSHASMRQQRDSVVAAVSKFINCSSGGSALHRHTIASAQCVVVRGS
eukprot:14679-Heterococcus_DN1.PRE.3